LRLGGTWPEVPVREKTWTEGHHDEDDDDRDEKGELAGAAEQGFGECVVARSVGDRHLGLEGEVTI